MSWEYVKCITCEKEYRVQLYGKIRQREWLIENWNRSCDNCIERLKREANETAAKENKKNKLPELEGSEKQIAWAETIRAKLIKEINQYQNVENFTKNLSHYFMEI